MRVHVFVGPTLAAREVVAAVPGAAVLPPVAHGDLLRLDPEPGDAVVLVDGRYHQVGSVRHKEILHLIARGVRVVGCASMGALRAAELHPFGMLGHGTVFGLYRDGVIDGDDEVALAHGEGPAYRPLTLPLVNMRHLAGTAARLGVLSAAAAGDTIALAADVPYTARTWPAVRERAAATGPGAAGAVDALRRFAAEHPEHADLKANDARRTLVLLDELLAGAQERPAWAAKPDWRNRGLHGWLAEYGGAAVDGVHVGDAAVARYRQLHEPAFPRYWRRHVLGRIAADSGPAAPGSPEWAGTGGSDASAEAAALAAAARRGLTPASVAPRFRDAWLTRREARDLSPAAALLTVLVRSYRPARGTLAELVAATHAAGEPVPPEGTTFRRTVAECLAVNAEVATWGADRHVEALRTPVLRAHLVAGWGVDAADGDGLRAAAWDRGFGSDGEAVEALRPFYLRSHFMALDGDTSPAGAR